MAMAVPAASTAASRGVSTSAPATTCTGSTCSTSTSMVAVAKRFSGAGQTYNALLATRVPTQGKGRAAVAKMASSSGPSNGVTAALDDSPVVGNVAPNFEAEAAFDQEFVKFSHLAGIQTDRKSGGLGDLGYQSISDLTKTLSKLCNVLIPDQGIAMRGLPFIDDQGVVQHSTINNSSSDAPVPLREEEESAPASAPDCRADASFDTGVHPSWLHTFLDGGAAMEQGEGGVVGPALDRQDRHSSWDTTGREDTTPGWTYAPDLPRGLVGRHFGGLAMASVLLGLGYTVLVGGGAEAAADLVAAGHHHVSSGSSPIAALDSDMRAIAFGGPEGPLVEEFWDNMRRYGLYFLTVASGGLYSLLKPALDLLKNPVSAVLVVTVLGGSFYLVYLTLSTMLGLSDFNYSYS